MVKTNLINYINRNPIIIHQDKKMDFFYMDDLALLVSKIIINKLKINEINCTYKKTFTLLDIANLINNLDDHKVEIQVLNKNEALSYYGKFNIPSTIDLIGLEKGLKLTYNILKENLT
jgi:hypothetical protein